MEVTSNVKQIPFSQQMVYDILSNPSRLEKKMRENIPADQKEKADAFSFTDDSIVVSAPGMGSVTLNIVEREAPKTIKFQASVAMVKGNMWIQLLPTTDTSSKMKLTIKADVPFFMKGMVQKPLTEGVEKIADMLAMLPYNTI